MNEAVLLYNYKGERLKAVREVLLSLKIPVKTVGKRDFSKPVGELFGLSGIEPLPSAAPEFTGELMVVKNFSELSLNIFLNALGRRGFNEMPLMSFLTPSNSRWSGNRLYKTVSEERELLSQDKKIKLNL